MLYGLVGLLAVLVLGAVSLVLAPPTGLIRDRLIAEVKQRTGRDLTIAGEARLTFLPSLGVALKDVTLSSPPAMPGAPLLRVENLEVQVALLPLVTREVIVEKLVLHRPLISLRVDAEGRRSWDFAEAEALRQSWPLRYAQAAPREQSNRVIPKELQDFARHTGDRAARDKQLAGLNGLSLADVRIVEGTLQYADARQHVAHVMTGIDARLSLDHFSGPLTVSGTALLGGERVAIEANVQSLKDALDERATKVTAKLTASALEASYDGTLAAGLVMALDGRMTLSSPSVDALARFLSIPFAGAEALGALTLDGQLKISGATGSFSSASIGLGETTAKGTIAVDAAGSRPQVKANLKFAALDFNRFTAVEPRVPPPAPAGPAGRFAAPPAMNRPSAPAQSIEDLLDQSSGPAAAPAARTKVRGFTKRSEPGWSSEAMDLKALQWIDADGRFEFGRIVWGKVNAGQTVSAVNLKGGVLKLDIAESQLYGGKAKGLVNIDARQQEIGIGANLSTDGVATLALLRDVADIDLIDGRGRIIVAVSARGGSERELIGTLAGKAELQMANGAIIGWDATQMLSGLGQGRIPKLDRQLSSKTPFTELSASFQIANGVARTQDIKFESPSLRSTGAGVVNIVDRNIDLMLRPKQSAAAVGGLSFDVPVRIAGPWDKVSVIPELGSALKTPQAQEAVKKLKDGDVDGALRSVVGNGPKADEKIGKAKALLKQFLKQ